MMSDLDRFLIKQEINIWQVCNISICKRHIQVDVFSPAACAPPLQDLQQLGFI